MSMMYLSNCLVLSLEIVLYYVILYLRFMKMNPFCSRFARSRKLVIMFGFLISVSLLDLVTHSGNTVVMFYVN